MLIILAISSTALAPLVKDVNAADSGVFLRGSFPNGTQERPSVIEVGSSVMIWLDAGSSRDCCTTVEASFQRLDGGMIELATSLTNSGAGNSSGTTRFSALHSFDVSLYPNGLRFTVSFFVADTSGRSASLTTYVLIDAQAVPRYAAGTQFYNGWNSAGTQFDTQASDGQAQVLQSAVSDFLLTVSPSTITVAPGVKANYTVTVYPINQFSWPLSLSVTTSPSTNYVLSSNSLTPQPGGLSTSLAVSSSTQGTFSIYVTGNGGLQTHSYLVTLVVSTSPPPPSGGDGSPFVYEWNGTGYALDNNLLPASHETQDFVNDSYLLGYRPVLENGLIPIKVGEFENNTDYFDQMRLLAVTHSTQVKVGISPSGQVLTYTNPMAPSYAQTDNGTNILPLLAQANGVYWQGTPGRYVIVKYAQVPRSSSYKLVVVSDGCYNYCKMSIHVQIRNQDGTWLDADVIHPRVYWSTDLVDLSRYLPSQNGGFQVRLFFTSDHKLDFVGLDTSSPAPIITTQLQMVSAMHSSYGDASQALEKADGNLVDITPGQKILLKFASPPPALQGQVTDFVMGTVGRYFLMKSGDTRGTGDPYRVLNMTYTFTTGGVDRSTISSLQVDAQAWTDVASNDTVFLQMWDPSGRVWVGLGDFQGRTTPWTYSVGSAAAICPGQGGPCPEANTVVLRWYFLSANIQLLDVDYMRVSLFDTRSNQDVVTSAFQKDIRYDRGVPSAGAEVTAYVSNPISSAGSCITDGSGSCVLNLALNQYDFWAMTTDSGYGMSMLNVTSSPYLALDATIGMVPPSTSTTVLEGTNTSYVEPLFQVTLDRSNLGGVGASVETTPFYNLTQLSSRATFTSSSPLVYWSNVSIIWFLYWWDSQSNRMWLDQNPSTGDWFRQYRYGSDAGAPSCNNPYKYDTSQGSSTFCYGGWNNYDPWYPGSLGGLLQIAVHGDCYTQNIRTYCENAQPGYDTPYSFTGITKLLQQSNSTFRGVVAYGYGYVGKSDPLRYALDTVASQMFTAFNGIQEYYGNSSNATSHINSVYSTLQTPSATQSFASSSLRLYYGNYPSSFVATVTKPPYVLSTSHMVISTTVVPDPYLAFISSKDSVQPTDFTYVSARSRANVEDYLAYTNFKKWNLSDAEVNSLTGGLSYLPQYLSNQIIYGSILDSLSAKTFRVAVTPTLYADPGATWNWTTWYRAGVVQTLSSSSVVSAPAYEPDIFERNIQSYVQGLKRGSFLKNNFIPATLYPVAIVSSGAVINYTYRVDYEDVPSGLWITSLERVQADSNGNCVGLDNRAYQGTSQHSINQLVYHSFAKLDIGVDLVAFAGEHISAHNAGWTQYRFFMASPGRGHYKLSFYTKGFSATLSVLSAAFLAYNVYIDVGMASDQPVPETVVSFARDASGFAEIALKLLKFGKIAGPLGVFTLGFSIGYTIGEALGLGAIGKVLLGFDAGFALIALVYTEPELFVVLIVAFAVIAYVFSLLGR